MSEELTVGIYVPSYKRAETSKTCSFLKDCTYVVRKSEEEAYKKRGVKVWSIEDEKIDSFCKVTNYINDNAPEDVIVQIDDDSPYMIYRLDKDVQLTDNDTIVDEIYRIAQCIYDLGIGFGCTSASPVPYGYTQEFTFVGSSGGIRFFNKSKYKARFNDEYENNCDIDVVLQELLVNRIILRPLYLVHNGNADTESGGIGRSSRSEQLACVENMKKKWGKYFSYNIEHNRPRINVKR